MWFRRVEGGRSASASFEVGPPPLDRAGRSPHGTRRWRAPGCRSPPGRAPGCGGVPSGHAAFRALPRRRVESLRPCLEECGSARRTRLSSARQPPSRLQCGLPTECADRAGTATESIRPRRNRWRRVAAALTATLRPLGPPPSPGSVSCLLRLGSCALSCRSFRRWCSRRSALSCASFARCSGVRTLRISSTIIARAFHPHHPALPTFRRLRRGRG